MTPKLLLPILCLLSAPVMQIQAADPVLFRATFDDSSAATKEAKAVLKEGALMTSQDSILEYDLGLGFPGSAGSLELRFRPLFSQKSEGERRVALSLIGESEKRLDFEFEPQGSMWRFATQFPDWRRQLSAAYFTEEHEQRWTHLVLTWDEKARPAPVLRLYRDGKWARSQTEAYRQSFSALRRLVISGAAPVALDEIVIYREALAEGDVARLSEGFGKADRIADWQTWRKAEALALKTAKAARSAQIAQLKGRVAQIINPRGGAQRDFKLPGGIVATGVRVEDVGEVDLSRFAVIYGPPGAGYQLTKEQDEVLRQFVRAGGGYVGVCAGANYAGKTKLLPMTTHSLKNQGLVTVGVRPHAITQGFSGEIVIHHGNGPVMVPAEGCEVLGTYQFGQNFPITTAAIVAGSFEEGRVVAFGPHPTGGGVHFQSKGANFSGQELGSDPLLVNALLWAAKILEPEEVKP